MKKEICWETVEFLLHEAIENLQRLDVILHMVWAGAAPEWWTRRPPAPDQINEATIEQILSQVYRNLNFAWNARYCQPSEMDRDFAKKVRFPKVFAQKFNASGSVKEG